MTDRDLLVLAGFLALAGLALLVFATVGA